MKMMRVIVLFGVCSIFIALTLSRVAVFYPAKPTLIIGQISAAQEVNRYEKYEITFQISGVQAANLQLPYLSPAEATDYLKYYINKGISVDAIFTAPDGKTYNQPAFYYEE